MLIAEVAEKYNVTVDTLRYYERIGLIPYVNRTRGGMRDYTAEDERQVEFVTCMRNAGLSIEVLIEYVALFQQGDVTNDARKALLIEQRRLLAEKIAFLQKTLDRLDTKIERYENVLLERERAMSGFNEQRFQGHREPKWNGTFTGGKINERNSSLQSARCTVRGT